MKIDVYSDGSGMTADTDGGYGWVIVIEGRKFSEGSGHLNNVSNNDMELEGAIQGLTAAFELINDPKQIFMSNVEVTLVSDSQIVLGWASGEYRFKQEHKIEKYKKLKHLMMVLNAKTRWVKGHSGDEFNTRCDKLANNARKGISEEALDKETPKGDTRIGTKKAHVISLWYAGQLKVIDFETGIIENYSREVHGKRGSVIEIREDKTR